MKKQKGFTLIELLVVIAIIAILSTVVMAGLNSARAKGRDAKRLSDIKQLQSALELCFDNGAGYPSTAVGVVGTAGLVLGYDCDGVVAAPNIPFSTYMNPLPTNPAPGGEDYTYCGEATPSAATVNPVACTLAGSTSYRLGFHLEGQSGSLTGAVDHQASPSGIQ